MSDMIERVAAALKAAMEYSGCVTLQANGPHGEVALQQFFEVLAMDAIEAMRDPPASVRLDADGHDRWEWTCHMCGGPKENWERAIDAALTSPSTSLPR